jgi:diguanylate cyclase (GGDEF)-like protein
MTLDLPISLAITGFTATVAGCLLLMSWLHHRNVTALALWGSAFIMAAIAAELIAARHAIPDFLSIVVANTVLAAAYGAMWSGARNFDGRRIQWIGALAGALIWLLACIIPTFYATPTARATLIAAIGVAYTLLTVVELGRTRGDALLTRLPIMILLIVHAASIPLRIPLVGSLAGTQPVQVNLLILVTFESVLISMCGAYMFGSLVKERITNWYKRASLIDPLTGVANRRAFLKQGARILLRSATARRSTALLLFDLDYYKSVNDRFGHSTGDRVLVAFCRVVTEQLRPTDFFARMGGEEFGCLLPDTTLHDARLIAERARTAVEHTRHNFGSEQFVVTVSVGVAATDTPSCGIASLLAMADRALYRAKQQGRNQVVSAEPAREYASARLPRIA